MDNFMGLAPPPPIDVMVDLAVLPKRRLNFSLAMKQQAVTWILGPGLGSPRRAVTHFRQLNWEVTVETMDKWWKSRAKIMGSPEMEPKWTLLSAEQELALANAIRRRARKVRVSSKWIVQAVRHMYPEKAHRKFSASKTWLLGFTQRHGLHLISATVVSSVPEAPRRRSNFHGTATLPPIFPVQKIMYTPHVITLPDTMLEEEHEHRISTIAA